MFCRSIYYICYRLFIVSFLRSHRSQCGYKSIELLNAINKLIVNDNNKKGFIEAKILPAYIHILKHDGGSKSSTFSDEEQLAAVQGLWNLAFLCSDEVRKEDGCQEGEFYNLFRKIKNNLYLER